MVCQKPVIPAAAPGERRVTRVPVPGNSHAPRAAAAVVGM
jgi:hypothetical protein